MKLLSVMMVLQITQKRIVHEINELYGHEINISFIHNVGVHGVCKNFENALIHCKGDYIFLSDQDDIWLHGKVKKVIDTFVQFPNALCVAHDSLLIDQNGEIIDDIINRRVNGDNLNISVGECIHLPRSQWLEFSVMRSLANGMVMCISSDLLQESLPFPNVPYHDSWLSFIAVENDGFYYLNNKLTKYRLHGDNTCGITGYRGNVFQRIKRKSIQFLSRANSYTLMYLPAARSMLKELEKSDMQETTAYKTAERIEDIGKQLFNYESKGAIAGSIGLTLFFIKDMRFRRSGAGQYIYELLYILLNSKNKRIKNLNNL